MDENEGIRTYVEYKHPDFAVANVQWTVQKSKRVILSGMLKTGSKVCRFRFYVTLKTQRSITYISR